MSAPSITLLAAPVTSQVSSAINGHAGAAETLKIVWTEFPPYIYSHCIEQQCQARGPLAEMTNVVLNSLNYQAQHVSLPVKRAYHQVQTGKADVSFHFKASRHQFINVIYGQQPLLAMSVSVYSLPGTPEVLAKEELAGQLLITRLSYGYGGLRDFINNPENHIHKLETRSARAALQALVARRAPYLLEYHVSPVLIDELVPGKRLQRQVLSAQIPLYWLLAKARPGAEKLLVEMEAAYKRLADEGRLPGAEFRLLGPVVGD